MPPSPLGPRHRVVLFDIDHTLLRAGGAGRAALEKAVLEVVGRPAETRNLAVKYSGRTDPSILRDLLTVMGLEPAPALMARIFDVYVERLPAEMGDGSRGLVLPGVRETLARLSGRADVHVGLLTGNIARGARIKLAPYGLERAFAFGAYGDDADERPALLPIALERWRQICGNGTECAMSDVYVVGDTPNDVAVARAHGARAVGVATGAPFVKREEMVALAPDFFFDDLTCCGPWVDEVLGLT